MFQLVGIILNSEDTVLVKRNLMEQFCMAISLVLWFQPQKKHQRNSSGALPQSWHPHGTSASCPTRFRGGIFSRPVTFDWLQFSCKWVAKPSKTHDPMMLHQMDLLIFFWPNLRKIPGWYLEGVIPSQVKHKPETWKAQVSRALEMIKFRFLGWFSRSLPSPIFGFCFSFCKFDRNLSLQKDHGSCFIASCIFGIL